MADQDGDGLAAIEVRDEFCADANEAVSTAKSAIAAPAAARGQRANPPRIVDFGTISMEVPINSPHGSLYRPWQAFGDTPSHDPFDIVRRQEFHFLGKQGDGLPIGAVGA